MSDKIKVGIVGLGRISTLHLEAYNKKYKLGAEVVAVCDKSKKIPFGLTRRLSAKYLHSDYE